MIGERKTYISKDGIYELDPEKIFEVVADLSAYMSLAVSQAWKDNPQDLMPTANFVGHGNELRLFTGVIDQPGVFRKFNLAGLINRACKDTLTLRIYAHPNVAIPSERLHTLGKQYKR